MVDSLFFRGCCVQSPNAVVGGTGDRATPEGFESAAAPIDAGWRRPGPGPVFIQTALIGFARGDDPMPLSSQRARNLTGH